MWISPDCHGIVAVLVISGKQPSSGLLHTLRYICVCVWPLSAVSYNIASSTSHRGSTLVFPGTRSHASPHRLTSTTQPLCHCGRVYHNIHNSYKRVPVPRVLCHSLTELTEIPGKGMGFLRKFQKFWVRVRKCYRTHRSSEHVQK